MSTMNIQFSGPATDALKTFATEKFSRLKKFSAIITSIQVIFKVENKLRHIAEANIHVPKKEIYAEAESEDMYKTIDSLVDKLSRQLTSHKEKISGHS